MPLPSRSESKSKGLFIAFAAAVIYGLYPSAARKAYDDGANATYVILITTFLRGLSLSFYCIVRSLPLLPKPSENRAMLWGGFFQALSVIGIISSLRYLPGPVTIIVVFSHTIMLLFLLAALGQQRLTPIAIGTTITALVGLSFVVDLWNNLDGLSVTGLGLASMAAIVTTFRLYIFGRQMASNSPATIGAQVFSTAAFFSLVLLLIDPAAAPQSAAGYGWVLCAAVSLILGTFGMFYGIAALGAFQYSLMSKLEPIFTALFSILILGEFLTLSQYFGMLVVLLSLAAYQNIEGRARGAELQDRQDR